METIAAHAVLLIQLVGDSIHISLGRHGLMEGGIKNTYLRQTRHQFLHGINTLQVSGVVQRSQVADGLESLQYLVSEDNALVELLTSMHHAVTDGIDFLQIFDDTDFRVGQQREDELHTLRMLGDIVHNLLLLTIGELYLYKSAVQAYTLGTTLTIGELYLYKSAVQAYTLGTTAGHHTLVVHVVQCVLDRGRTTV